MVGVSGGNYKKRGRERREEKERKRREKGEKRERRKKKRRRDAMYCTRTGVQFTVAQHVAYYYYYIMY